MSGGSSGIGTSDSLQRNGTSYRGCVDRPDGISKQCDTIRKVMKALFAAQRFMRSNTADAAEIIAKTIGWSPEAVLAAHKISGPLLSADGTRSGEALANMQHVLLEYGVIKKRLPLEDHLAEEFTPVRL